MSQVAHPSSQSIGASTRVKNFLFNHKIELLAVIGLISCIAIGHFVSVPAGLVAGGIVALGYGGSKAYTSRNQAVQQAKVKAVVREEEAEDQALPSELPVSLPRAPLRRPKPSLTAEQLEARAKRQEARQKILGRPTLTLQRREPPQ